MNSLTILRDDPNRSLFADGSVSRLDGERGAGFCRLVLVVKLHVEAATPGTPQQERPRLTGLVADVNAGGVNIGRFWSHPWSWGGGVEAPAMQSRSTEVRLECDVDHARLEAIEDIRAGGSLQLQVNIQAQVNGSEWQLSVVPHVVNQSAWADVLAAAGYRQTLLLEIPVPDAAAHPELAAAAAYLGQAQQHLLAGLDREAVGSCRDVLEELKKLPGADLSKSAGDQKTWSKAETVSELRKALTVLTHPARHRDEDAARILWSRVDARALITMTAGLMTELTADEARAAPAG